MEPLPWSPASPGPSAPSAQPARSGPSAQPARSVLPWLADGPPVVAVAPRRRRLVLLVAAALGFAVAAGVALLVPGGGGPRVTTPFLTYTAPAGWSADDTGHAPVDAPAFTGAVHGPTYDCRAGPAVRGYAAATLLPADVAAGSAPADRAERLARWFAAASYTAADGTAPQLTVAAPRPVRVDGPAGPVDATVTEVTAQPAAAPGCADRGTVLALAAPVSGGAALLLVAADAAGGPADPAPAARSALDAVVASVRLT